MNITILAKLVARDNDGLGYITYVFKALEPTKALETDYMMCTRFPNWNDRLLDVGEQGYVTVKEIEAGVDHWFDGTKMIPYNYSNIQFIKFITLSTVSHKEIILLINLILIIMKKN